MSFEDQRKTIPAPKFEPKAPVTIESAIRDLIPPGSRFTYLDRGGENLVFSVESDGTLPASQFVRKISVLPIQKWLKMRDQERRVTDEEITAYLEQIIENRKEKITRLRQVFGPRAVPRESVRRVNVPVSQDIVRAVYPPEDHDLMYQIPEHGHLKIPSILTTQERYYQSGGRMISFSASYPETDFFPPEMHEQYRQASRLLWGELQAPHEYSMNLVSLLYPFARNIDRIAQEDHAVKHSLQELAKKLIRHAKETGDPIDFAGHGNVMLRQVPHGVEPFFTDPFVFPYTDSYLDLDTVLDKVRDDKPLDEYDGAILVNRMNSIRAINMIAIASGIPDRFQYRGLQDVGPHVLRKEMEMAHMTFRKHRSPRPSPARG